MPTLPRIAVLMLGLTSLACDGVIGGQGSGGSRSPSASPSSEVQSSVAWAAAFETAGQEPFSFTYGGTPSSGILGAWRVGQTKKESGDRVRLAVDYRDPATGLTLRCEVTRYKAFAALEWVLRFKNTGTSDTPVLADVWPLDASMGPGAGDYTVRHARGSHAGIDDFQPRTTAIGAGGQLTLAPFGGRSSDGALPFFNVAYPGGGGFVAGVGWSGQWNAHLTRAGGAPLRVRAGMEKTHLVLHPGEEIRTPAVLLLFWDGSDPYRGQVFLRRLLKAHYSPKTGKPPIAAAAGGIPFEKISEANMLAGITNVAANKLPVDTWWIDAGWFAIEPSQPSWARWVGNFEPDPVRFPNGLKPVADAAHKHGLRFQLWFEPERAMPGTWMYKNHPEWLIAPPADLPSSPVDQRYMYNDGFHLVNLGIPAARDWLRKKVSSMIGSIGVDIYRHDMNLYPLHYWRSGEPANRQGMNEIRHVTGLYAYLDGLVQDHPNLLIDGCASGGRRIDFEMLRRGFVLWRSDHVWHPVGQQNHTFGLSRWLPITGAGAASTDAYSVRSGLGYHGVFAFDFWSAGSSAWTAGAQALKQLAQVRELFLGDFTTLTGTTDDQSACVAWQYDRPDLGKGLVQVFRRPGCPDSALSFPLVGLDRSASYRLTDLDGGAPRVLGGAALLDQGLTVPLPSRPQAKLLVYERTTASSTASCPFGSLLPNLCRPFAPPQPTAATPDPASCTDRLPVTGTAGTYTGADDGRDVVAGLDGDDVIIGLGCSDRLSGNKGHDQLHGNKGNDELRGGQGNDTLRGGQGNDSIWGGGGDDTIHGGGGDDRFYYAEGDGHDVIHEYGGRDTIVCAANGARPAARILGWGRAGDDLRLSMSGNGSITVVGFFTGADKAIEAIVGCD